MPARPRAVPPRVPLSRSAPFRARVKVAFLADVASNLPAFEAALDRAKRWGAGEVVLVGDLVAAGPHPAEVVALARKRHLAAVAGPEDRAVASRAPSHDAIAARLDAGASRWLAGLPSLRRARWGRSLVLVACGVDADARGCDVVVTAGSRRARVERTPAGVARVDAGSVGRSLDGPEATLVLADFDAPSFEIARVPFDVESFERDFRRARAEWLIVPDSGFHATRGA